MNSAFALMGLFTALLFGCVALGIWIIWELTGISKKLKKW